MELSELAAYAKEKYHMKEQHKWADLPGLSVLCHPSTGKWVALLMRQWDTEIGEEIERCDMKCGAQVLERINKPYISAPVRMRGQKWVGIAFDVRTEPDVIFRLLDYTIEAEKHKGNTIILENTTSDRKESYHDTPLPFINRFPNNCTEKPSNLSALDIPEKIREMISLYEYGDGSLSHKARNFYRQGKFMENYEDDAPWAFEYRRYFTTYHDLNVRQLRGYFSWRTHIRKGDCKPIATSLAYIYLYELLNGIGVMSPEDTLNKMLEFEKGYLDSGIGDPDIKKNLHKWMFEYAIIHGLPSKTVAAYMDPVIREKDISRGILKAPKQHTEKEIFSALCTFGGNTLIKSPVMAIDENKARHLFAEVWKNLSEHYYENQKDIFTACFGEQKSYSWHPLSNAVYYDERSIPDTDFVLNECRAYHLRDGVWREERYESLYFNKAIFKSIIHATDRILRKYYKTGHYLHEKQEEAWLTPYITAVIEAERLAEIDAQKPKITIDFSSLTQIRQEAIVTRDSLLTEEETEESEDVIIAEQEEKQYGTFDGLNALHLKILKTLLSGLSIDELIKTEHLLPSVVTDTINEALFDEIGDNILDCDGNKITFVDDYREDVIEVLGGNTNE